MHAAAPDRDLEQRHEQPAAGEQRDDHDRAQVGKPGPDPDQDQEAGLDRNSRRESPRASRNPSLASGTPFPRAGVGRPGSSARGALLGPSGSSPFRTRPGRRVGLVVGLGSSPRARRPPLRLRSGGGPPAIAALGGRGIVGGSGAAGGGCSSAGGSPGGDSCAGLRLRRGRSRRARERLGAARRGLGSRAKGSGPARARRPASSR